MAVSDTSAESQTYLKFRDILFSNYNRSFTLTAGYLVQTLSLLAFLPAGSCAVSKASTSAPPHLSCIRLYDSRLYQLHQSQHHPPHCHICGGISAGLMELQIDRLFRPALDYRARQHFHFKLSLSISLNTGSSRQLFASLDSFFWVPACFYILHESKFVSQTERLRVATHYHLSSHLAAFFSLLIIY